MARSSRTGGRRPHLPAEGRAGQRTRAGARGGVASPVQRLVVGRLAVLAKIPRMSAAPTYVLPESAIAQTPAEPRDAARLLVDVGRAVEHHAVRELPRLLREGDLVVVNE